MYIYYLWVAGSFKGKVSELTEYAKENNIKINFIKSVFTNFQIVVEILESKKSNISIFLNFFKKSCNLF